MSKLIHADVISCAVTLNIKLRFTEEIKVNVVAQTHEEGNEIESEHQEKKKRNGLIGWDSI